MLVDFFYKFDLVCIIWLNYEVGWCLLSYEILEWLENIEGIIVD